jgi:hypothetical protein
MSIRVTVRPMHHATLPVPFVLADELDRRAGPQPVDSGSEIEVVRDQNRLTRGEPENESLVPCTLDVVFQDLRNDPMATDLNAALVIAVRGGERLLIALLRRSRASSDLWMFTGGGCRFQPRPCGSVVEHSVLECQRVNDAQQSEESEQFSQNWQARM